VSWCALLSLGRGHKRQVWSGRLVLSVVVGREHVNGDATALAHWYAMLVRAFTNGL
jgi:hypothetical protein